MCKYHKYAKNKPELRTALWIVYGKKDAYTDSPIEYRELEVDHIIPQALFKNKEELYETLDSLEVSRDFEKDCLENYLPTKRGSNKKKGKSLNAVPYGLSLAENNVEAVEKEMQKYKKKGDIVTEATKTAILCDTYDNKELACDIILQEKGEFDNIKIKEYSYLRSKKRVSLKALLPTKQNPHAYCWFEFKSLKMRDCIIAVDEKEILENLFFSNGIYDQLNKRRFITGNEDGYVVSLGNCIFPLAEIEIRELCELIDEFSAECLKEYDKIDEFNNGILKNKKNEAILCQISLADYKKLMSFANSSSKSLGCNVYEDSIKVYKEAETLDINAEYHAIIYARCVKETVAIPTRIELCLDSYYLNEENIVSFDNYWNPKIAREWLIKKFFIACEKQKKGIINFILKKRENFAIDYRFPEEKYQKIREYSTVDELRNTVQKLQTFYASRKGGYLIFFKEEQDKILDFLKLILRCTKDYNYFSYIDHNLDLSNKLKCEIDDKMQVLDAIRIMQKDVNNYRTYRSAEVIFRCCIDVLNKGKTEFNFSNMEESKKYIQNYIEEYNNRILIEKYLAMIEK